jgi:hypothetical protein
MPRVPLGLFLTLTTALLATLAGCSRSTEEGPDDQPPSDQPELRQADERPRGALGFEDMSELPSSGASSRQRRSLESAFGAGTASDAPGACTIDVTCIADVCRCNPPGPAVGRLCTTLPGAGNCCTVCRR